MRNKRFEISERLASKIKSRMNKMKAGELSKDEMSFVNGGDCSAGCRGICKITCSLYCAPGCVDNCGEGCAGTCYTTCDTTCQAGCVSIAQNMFPC